MRISLDDDVVGGQQKQSPEEGIPEGGPIPLHRDTTILGPGAADPVIDQIYQNRVRANPGPGAAPELKQGAQSYIYISSICIYIHIHIYINLFIYMYI